jgi:hypothetical protein
MIAVGTKGGQRILFEPAEGYNRFISFWRFLIRRLFDGWELKKPSPEPCRCSSISIEHFMA